MGVILYALVACWFGVMLAVSMVLLKEVSNNQYSPVYGVVSDRCTTYWSCLDACGSVGYTIFPNGSVLSTYSYPSLNIPNTLYDCKTVTCTPDSQFSEFCQESEHLGTNYVKDDLPLSYANIFDSCGWPNVSTSVSLNSAHFSDHRSISLNIWSSNSYGKFVGHEATAAKTRHILSRAQQHHLPGCERALHRDKASQRHGQYWRLLWTCCFSGRNIF